MLNVLWRIIHRYAYALMAMTAIQSFLVILKENVSIILVVTDNINVNCRH